MRSQHVGYPLHQTFLWIDPTFTPSARIRQARLGQNQLFLTVTNLTPGVTNELLLSVSLSANTWQSLRSFQALQSEVKLTETVSSNLNKGCYRIRTNP